MKIKIFLTIIIASQTIFAAQGLQHEDSKVLAKELANTINESILEIEKLEKQYSTDFNLSKFVLTNDDVSAASLGLLLESKDNLVIAITPTLIASEMGVLIGDKVENIVIDGKEFSSVNENLGFAIKNARKLAITVDRQGKSIALSKGVDIQSSPDWKLSVSNSASIAKNTTNSTSIDAKSSECGYVTNIIPAYTGKNMHKTAILKIDGESVAHRTKAYRLTPGKHTLEISESINSMRWLKFESDTQRRKSKIINIKVRANTSHHIAANFIKKGDRVDSTKKDYWRPIIWKERPRKCSL